MALSANQKATALSQVAFNSMTAKREGIVAVEVARQASEPSGKPGRPVKRTVVAWMIPAEVRIAGDAGLMAFHAGDRIEDPMLRGELERAGVQLIPLYE